MHRPIHDSDLFYKISVNTCIKCVRPTDPFSFILFLFSSVDGWMDGWMDEWMLWMDGWMLKWMDGWMKGRKEGRKEVWMGA